MESLTNQIKGEIQDLATKDFYQGVAVVRVDGVVVFFDSKDPLLTNRSAPQWAVIFNTLNKLSQELSSSNTKEIKLSSDKREYIFRQLSEDYIFCIFVGNSYDKTELDILLSPLGDRIKTILG